MTPTIAIATRTYQGVPPPKQPWDRLPTESPVAYQAVTAYLTMDPKGRSIQAVSAQLGKDRSLIGQWSRRHGWVARAKAWDDAQAAKRDEVVREALRQDALSLRGEQGTVKRQQLQAARALMREALRAIKAESDKAVPDARLLQLAGQALSTAIQQQRLATGLPTDVTRNDLTLRETVNEVNEIGKTVRMIIGEHLCDDCRDRVVAELRRLEARQQQLSDKLA